MPNADATILELAQRDRLRANLWAMLNGSSADCKRASDPATQQAAGDHDCLRGPSSYRVATTIREQMTRELLDR